VNAGGYPVPSKEVMRLETNMGRGGQRVEERAVEQMKRVEGRADMVSGLRGSQVLAEILLVLFRVR